MSNFFIWEGVYSGFAEAPAVGAGFSGPEHRRRAVESAKEAIDAVQQGVPIRRFLTQRTAVLPVVIASAYSASPRLSVLDFGGGLGIGYLTLLECLPGIAQHLDYQIVDLPAVCDAGRELFSSAKGISFHDNLPHASTRYDVVFTSSAIQYVEDWRGILRALAAFHSPLLLFSDVFAGDIPTYCSLQNYYGSKIPQWFFNVSEINETLASAGYRVGLKAHVAHERLGRTNGLQMENLPERNRIPETLTLMYHRQSA